MFKKIKIVSLLLSSKISLYILNTRSYQLCPFDTPPWVFAHFLTFWHRKTFQANLVFPLPLTWNQLLSQGVLVPVSRDWYLEKTELTLFES